MQIRSVTVWEELSPGVSDHWALVPSSAEAQNHLENFLETRALDSPQVQCPL